MCNIYSVTTNKEAIRELARAIGEWTDQESLAAVRDALMS